MKKHFVLNVWDGRMDLAGVKFSSDDISECGQFAALMNRNKSNDKDLYVVCSVAFPI